MKISNLLFGSHLEKGEKIAYIAHRHIFTEYKRLFKVIFLGGFLPLVFFVLFPPLKIAWGIWLLFGMLKFIYDLADWYFDAWLVTNLSIIDVEWNGFFNRTSTRIEYTAIKGVSYEIKGFWNTILRYGDVNLELATLNSIVTLEEATSPRSVERAILDTQAKFMDSKNLEDQETLKEILIGMIDRQRVQK